MADSSHVIKEEEIVSEEQFTDQNLDIQDEYEEISSEEVDLVVAVLEDLIDRVQSENIRAYLEEASNNIYYLVYEDEAEDDLSEAA